MTRYVLDRFEGDRAVVEDENGSMHSIDRCLVPDACEGDALVETDGHWSVDSERTRALREAVRQRLKKLKRT